MLAAIVSVGRMTPLTWKRKEPLGKSVGLFETLLTLAEVRVFEPSWYKVRVAPVAWAYTGILHFCEIRAPKADAMAPGVENWP